MLAAKAAQAARPEAKERRGAATRRNWSDPKYRKKQSASKRASWVKRQEKKRLEYEASAEGRFPDLFPRLKRAGLDHDEQLLGILATMEKADRWGYLDLYVIDKKDADHWLSLPKWKRAVRRGTPEDRACWAIFTILRMQHELLVEKGYPLATVAHSLRQIGGQLGSADLKRLSSMLSEYGCALDSVGLKADRSRKPWE